MIRLLTTYTACAALLTIAGSASAQAPPHYTVTDLGSLGGQESVATGINDRGQIVGGADTAQKGKGPEFITYVFVWQNGRMRKIAGLNGSHAYVTAVNGKGQMCGAYSPDPLKASFQAARFDGSKITRLGGFPADVRGFSLSQGEAINAQGQVVGVSNNQAFFWSGGRLRKLSPPAGFRTAEARAVNGAGQAAGKGEVPAGRGTRTLALVWDAAGRAKSLGTLPGYTDSVARAMNGRGQVVGWVSATGGTPGRRISFHYQAFLWQNGRMRGLGSIPRIPDSKAAAINDKGQVVGNAYFKTDEAALLWQGGRVYELNTLVPKGSGWKLQNADGINSRGWIIGNGIHNGIRRAFVLTPNK